MARTILRAGRIAGWVIIAGAVLGVVLYWAGVMSMAKTPGPGQSSEVTVDLEAETAAAEAARAAEAAAIADVEQAIREYLDAKRYAKLEAYCNAVLLETPYDSIAIRVKDAIVRSYILTGQDAQAAAATAELLNQFGSVPGASRALCNIGDAWRNEGKIAEAQQVYRETLVRYPGDEFARWSQLHLCMMALERNDVQETVDGVWRLIGDFDDDPGMPLAAIQIGEAFFKAGHRDIALEIYHSMLENYADNEATVWAQKNICTMLIDAGDDAEAAAALDTLITKFKSAPTTPSALMEVGDRYRDAKRYENALQAYQYAAAYDPNSLDARKAVCQTHLKLDDAEAAVEVVWEMIGDLAKDSGMPLAAVQVAEELAKARQPDMALEIYRYLVDNHADNEATVWAQKNICTMLIDAGDDAEAAAALDTLITKFKSVSTTPGALKEIGDRYRAAGKYDRALLAYEHAVAHDPDYLDARKALCLTQLRRNDVEGAAETVWRMMSELAEHEWMPLAAVQMGEEFAKAGRREIAMEINQYMVADHADRNEAAWAQKNICLMLIEAGDEPGAAAAIEVLSTMFATADATPESLLEIGDRYCDLKQFDRALEVYRLAAAGESNALYAEKAKCLALVHLKDMDGATDAVWRMMLDFSRDARMPLAAVQVGDAFLKAKQPEVAVEIYRYVVDHHAGSDAAVWAQKNICDMLIDAGDEAGTAMAIDKLKTHFDARQTVAAALLQLADKYRGLKAVDDARLLCKHVIDEYTDTASPLWAAQRLILIDIDESEDPNAPLETIPPPILAAVDRLRTDYAIHPELTKALFYIGEEYYRMGHYDDFGRVRPTGKLYWPKAIAVWQKLLNGDVPFDREFTPEAWWLTGVCQARMAQAPQALSSLQTVIKNWPEFKFAWNAQVWIGVCYEQLKRANRRKPKMDYDALIEEAYATVLEKYPDCTMVFLANLKLAELKYEQGRWEESAMHAERYLADKYIAHSAQRAGVLYKLGQCYEKMGEPDVARTVYQQHLTEFPDDKLPTHSKVLARLAAVNGGEQ